MIGGGGGIVFVTAKRKTKGEEKKKIRPFAFKEGGNCDLDSFEYAGD